MVWLFRMALYAVSLTTVVLWGKSGVTADRVTLWMDWPNGFSPLAVQQLERELHNIVEPAGLQLGWRRLPAKTGATVDGASIVVRFRGTCSPESSPRRHRPVAGWAHASDGTILPFIEIDCDQVWSVIEADLDSESGFQREFHLGRALGRVVAHELYHVLTNRAAHGSEGLTKARLDSRDLISGKYTLTQAYLMPQVEITDSASPAAPLPSLPTPPPYASRPDRWRASSVAPGHGSERSSFPGESSAAAR